MAGTGYGDNGSVIGPANTPTTSAASGVWSLGELAEAERDDIWPSPKTDFEFIAKVGPMDGTTTSVSFTSIPQTFRHLRIVMANGRRDSSGNAGIYLVFNSNTTVGDYGGWIQMHAGPSITRADSYWPPFGDIPSTTNSSSAVWDIADYANASVGHSTQWQFGADTTNSGYRGIGTTNWHPSSLAAITQIDVTSSSTSSGYYLEAPTTFTLFGIGTAA